MDLFALNNPILHDTGSDNGSAVIVLERGYPITAVPTSVTAIQRYLHETPGIALPGYQPFLRWQIQSQRFAQYRYNETFFPLECSWSDQGSCC